jgi:mersacidin/lichenicidin family type 2 lantibiotic
MKKGENMSTNIIRAWKDVEYRKTLTPEQLAGLPANPVEPIALSDEGLRAVVGGFQTSTTYPDCCDNSTIGPKP